jgi:hypothetical protein
MRQAEALTATLCFLQICGLLRRQLVRDCPRPSHLVYLHGTFHKFTPSPAQPPLNRYCNIDDLRHLSSRTSYPSDQRL